MTDAISPGHCAPDAPSSFKRRMTVIMAADVAGYSRLLATGEEDALELFQQCRSIFDAEVARYGGRIFNTAGDSVMSEFASAVEAVRAAIAIQHALEAVNRDHLENRRVQFRIGITIGDVIERNADLLGDGVNIASRLESLAPPGGVCVSRSVHDAVAGKVSAAFRSLGPQELKNIPTLVEAFLVTLPAADPREGVADRPIVKPERRHKPEERQDRAGRRGRRLARFALIALAITILIPTLRYSKHLLETQLGLKLAKPPAESVASPPKPFAADRVTPTGAKPDVAATARGLYQKGQNLEASGDLAAARAAYIESARVGAGFIDPLLRLAALVRLRDGADVARSLFADLSTVSPDRSIRMVYAQQLPQAEQTARLKRILDEDPSFSPAWHAYALAINDTRGGLMTLARMRAVHAALDRFLAANKTGALQRFFIDPSTLQEWVEWANQRTDEIDAAFARQPTRPTLSYQIGPSHLTVNIALPEGAASVQYRLGDRGGFSRAELSTAEGGKTSRSASFTIPAKAGKTNIYISYADTDGLAAGPFVYRLDATELASERQRNILLATSGSWVHWATDRDELYFHYLLNYRCAIRSAFVGFDGAEPDIALPLPNTGCDDGAPPPPGSQNSVPAPHDARSVSVKLTLANGDAPPPVTISREP